MEKFILENDLSLCCVPAHSFPHDIGRAFEELVSKLRETEGRTFFGISYLDEKGEVIYKAGVLESFEGEGVKLGCEPFTVQKGSYISETIRNWQKDKTSIGITFRKMVRDNPNAIFPCVEWYKANDVMCLVRLANND